MVYESWLERHHLMAFDRLPQVTGIAGQPFAVSWTGALRRENEKHIPDFFVRFADGGGLVVDCRPVARADENSYRVAAISWLNSLACTCPCQRFATPSRDVGA